MQATIGRANGCAKIAKRRRKARMQNLVPRREFLLGMGAIAAATVVGPFSVKSPFRIAVINDEITQDFGRACEIASKEFGMGWIELRGMWNKNLLKLDAKEIEEARRILERSIELAKVFQTERVRCFDFWRLDDQAPHRTSMNEKLRDATERAAKKGVILVLENEPGCNTATAAEAAKVLAAVTSSNLMLNWDPGNAAERDEKPYPDGYNLLPKERIGHCHCKDAARKPDGSGYQWAAMGGGIIDWVGQFKALKRDGYHFAVSLETHWRGGGTPEESTRQSWAGMEKRVAGSWSIIVSGL